MARPGPKKGGAALAQPALAERRTTLGWSLTKAANRIGISRQNLWRLEHRYGNQAASVDVQIAIETVYRISRRLLFAVTHAEDGEWLSLSATERITGIPSPALRRFRESGRLFGRQGPDNAWMVERAEVERLLEQLLVQAPICPGCDGAEGPLPLGWTWHKNCAGRVGAQIRWAANDPDDHRRRVREASDSQRAWWASPEGVAHRAAVTQLVETPCVVCSSTTERTRSKEDRRIAQKRRTFCDLCWTPWLAAVLRGSMIFARVKAASSPSTALATSREAFLAAHVIGEEFDELLRSELWPSKTGRRRPQALNIAIEAAHSFGLADRQVTDVIRALQADGQIVVPGVSGPVNDRYVERRRGEAGIRRHRDQRRAA